MLQRNFYQEHAAKKVYTRKPKTSSESSRFVAGSNRHERYNLFFGSEIFPLNAVFEASTSTGAESVGVGDATRCPLVKTTGFFSGKQFRGGFGEGSRLLRFVVPKQWRFSSTHPLLPWMQVSER